LDPATGTKTKTGSGLVVGGILAGSKFAIDSMSPEEMNYLQK
jgi:hypothetical protein